jgi:hypothetical protein
LDEEELESQLGEDNEIQANVEQSIYREEIDEGGLEKKNGIDLEEEEVEQEEVKQEEAALQEDKIEEEDDSTNRMLRARDSKRSPILPTTSLKRKRPRLNTET